VSLDEIDEWVLMEKQIKIYDLHDPQQIEDEREYWRNKTPAEKLHALEVIRRSRNKLGKKQNGNQQRFRRIIRVIEPE
jgi:hypothetical protein